MKEQISEIVQNAITRCVEEGLIALGTVPDAAIERPRDSGHGDWSSSVALRCSKAAGMNPRALAEIIANHIQDSSYIESVEIAGPGFINIVLSKQARSEILREVRQKDRAYGHIKVAKKQRIQIEFISANPVGPMHVGHGRWAALGDSMARVLTATGHVVSREFYVNDAGVQMDIFGQSVSVRYLQLCGVDIKMPENGYHGAYITDIAQHIIDREGKTWVNVSTSEREHYFKERSYVEVLEHLKLFLSGFGVNFDCWFSERDLYLGQPNAIEQSITALRDSGYIYELDSALWFRSTDFGDDKDRVLIKADGSYTYFAADIAYHKNKFDRGFDRVINIWGADHHGYVARMKAACAALGNAGKLDVVIGQLVNLYRDGKPVRMSKRSGEMITFEELVDEVGSDAARYWFLRRSTDQQVDFDLTAAVEKSADNPIYYVQYAYARICSIIRKSSTVNLSPDILVQSNTDQLAESISLDSDLDCLTEVSEIALIRKLSEFPDVVELASRDLAPTKLTHYVEDLASAFHHFYAHCRVIDDLGDVDEARLFLCDATRRALRAAFDLIGIKALERM